MNNDKKIYKYLKTKQSKRKWRIGVRLEGVQYVGSDFLLHRYVLILIKHFSRKLPL